MRAGRKTGLTIVELMVGMVAASVLALTVGAIMYYSYRGWASVQAVGNMERDGALAMQTVANAVRGAASSNLTSVAAQFAKQGDKLRYTRAGVSMDLVRQGVQSFTNTISASSNQVTVVLNIREPTSGVSMIMTNVVTTRN
ncbi:MAG: hypothetical protein WCS01_06995 [bacterium]